MPQACYGEWMRVADEEATHSDLIHAHLQQFGHAYSDFPTHDGLREVCIKTQAERQRGVSRPRSNTQNPGATIQRDGMSAKV